MFKLAACACTSTKFSLAAAKALDGTEMALLVALLLPSAFTVLVRINCPSSTCKPCSSKESCKDFGTLKLPLATNLSLPFRTSELSLLPPRIRFKAVKIIVFPAPVSPVKTVKPGDISRVECSITPIERIDISSRNVRSLTAPALNGKFEFGHQSIAKYSVSQMRQLNNVGIFGNDNAISSQ